MALNRLTGLDAIFLAAETTECPLHVMAILLLDPSTVPGGYSFETMREFIAGRLPMLGPLRRRIVEVPFGLDQPGWVEERDIDLEYHVRRAALPSPGGPRELAKMTSEVMERHLDRSRPMWEMVLVEGLADGNIGVIAKLHHALMDGFSGVKMMASLVSDTPEYEEMHSEPPPMQDPVPGGLELMARSLPSFATRTLAAARTAVQVADAQLRSLLDASPEDPPEADEGNGVPLTILNQRITASRSTAYASLPLAELKAVKRHFGCTLNDVLLASVSSAVRAHLIERDALPDAPLYAGAPVSTHAADDDAANSYTNMFVSLATDVADPVECLRVIHAGTRRTKERRASAGSGAFKELMDVPAPFVFSLIADAYTRYNLWESVEPMCNLVVSNVPGPQDTLYLGGARLAGLYPLGPIFEGMALNVTAISCGDALGVGLVGCRDWLPDLWDLSDGIRTGLQELLDRIPGKLEAADIDRSASPGADPVEDAVADTGPEDAATAVAG